MCALRMFNRLFKNMGSDMRSFLKHRTEIKKYKDPKRKKIYETVKLSAEQEAAVTRLYQTHYGAKIPLTWHRHYTAYTGNFDVDYFPELLYIPEFEAFENLWPEYCEVYADKNVLPLLAAAAGVKMPKTILSCTKGMLRDRENRQIDAAAARELLEQAGAVFIKPTVGTSSGQGCFVAELQDGLNTLSGESAEALMSRLGTDFVIQERLVCHSSIQKIYAGSVNTFRLISYRWKDEILFVPSIMRIGRGGNCVDNAHAGGMFIAVDDDGRLHKEAFTEFREVFDRHPDTGLVFDGYRIPLFSPVKAAARRMHEMLPQVGVINWDFTIDAAGDPVLIEVNIQGGSIWLSEIAHGCGPFGENTPEILRWLRLMKNTRPADRAKYAFGNGV